MYIGSLPQVIQEGSLYKKITKWNEKHYDDPNAYLVGGALGGGVPGLMFGGLPGAAIGAVSGGLSGLAGYHLRDKNRYKKKSKKE